MVKYLLVNAFIFLTFLSIAQTDDKDVIITSSGSGTSQELAKQTALRNAIEQAFGTFISSKTEILNDEIVADQMSSVSSGNIKSYEVLNESQLPNGTWASTLRVIVSVDKLTSFVEAKGIAVEIKGGLFALNIKQQLLNEQGEFKAITEMIGLLHEPMQKSFDYKINSGEPQSIDAESQNWLIPLTVTTIANKNMDFCADYFIKTLKVLSLSLNEVEAYRSLNKKVFPVTVNYLGKSEVYFLRKEKSCIALESLSSQWEFYIRLFIIQSGLDEFSYVEGNHKKGEPKGKKQIHGFYSKKSEYNDRRSEPQIQEVLFSFLYNGQIAGTFNWNDKRTLNQIEQMTGYIIKPRGIISQFKHGGYVVTEKDGHGLVMSVVDCGKYNWSDSKKVCDEWNINGYSDWRMPTKEELEFLYNNMFKMGIGGLGLNDKGYWSSSDGQAIHSYYGDIESAIIFCFGSGNTYSEDYNFSNRPKDSEQRVRAVRVY